MQEIRNEKKREMKNKDLSFFRQKRRRLTGDGPFARKVRAGGWQKGGKPKIKHSSGIYDVSHLGGPQKIGSVCVSKSLGEESIKSVGLKDHRFKQYPPCKDKSSEET